MSTDKTYNGFYPNGTTDYGWIEKIPERVIEMENKLKQQSAPQRGERERI